MLHLRNLSYIVCWVVALFVAAEASVVVIEPVDLLPAPSAGFVDWPSVDCHLRVVIGIDPAAGWDQSPHSPHPVSAVTRSPCSDHRVASLLSVVETVTPATVVR